MGVYDTDTFTCSLSIKAHLAHLDASIAVFVVFVVVVNDVVVTLVAIADHIIFSSGQ